MEQLRQHPDAALLDLRVIGYSAWSMKLRWRFSSITFRASGSIQVVTKVARLRSGMPSTASSSSTSRIAWIGGIGSSGIASSGAPSVGTHRLQRIQSGGIVHLCSARACFTALAPGVGTPRQWRGRESNPRHHDFQSCALPTELPRLGGAAGRADGKASGRRGGGADCIGAWRGLVQRWRWSPSGRRRRSPCLGRLAGGPADARGAAGDAAALPDRGGPRRRAG